MDSIPDSSAYESAMHTRADMTHALKGLFTVIHPEDDHHATRHVLTQEILGLTADY